MGIRFERVALMERGKNEEALAFAATISDYMRNTYGVPSPGVSRWVELSESSTGSSTTKTWRTSRKRSARP